MYTRITWLSWSNKNENLTGSFAKWSQISLGTTRQDFAISQGEHEKRNNISNSRRNASSWSHMNLCQESVLTTQRLRKKILTRHWAKHCSMIFCSDISKPEVAPHSGAQHVGTLDACQGSSCRTGKERRTLCPTLLHHLRTPAAKPFSIVGCYLRRKSSHEFCPNVIHVWENMHTHTHCEGKEWAFTWMIIDLSLYIYCFNHLSLFLYSFCLPIYMHRIKLQIREFGPTSARLLDPYLVLMTCTRVCLCVFVFMIMRIFAPKKTVSVYIYIHICVITCVHPSSSSQIACHNSHHLTNTSLSWLENRVPQDPLVHKHVVQNRITGWW